MQTCFSYAVNNKVVGETDRQTDRQNHTHTWKPEWVLYKILQSNKPLQLSGFVWLLLIDKTIIEQLL